MPYSTISYRVSHNSGGNHTSKPAFEGAKDINLTYILNNHIDKLPERILASVKRHVNNVIPTKQDTLRELHLKTYSKILKCKNLEEAKKKFPEFACVLDLSQQNIKRLKFLQKFEAKPEDLSLHLLQEYYGKLKTQNEIIEVMNFPSRQSLLSVMEKINFPVFPKNYRILINASDEKGNIEIARKVRAYNQLHPDLVRAHNKIAAQGTKTEKYRKEQSVRIKKYDKEHPERRAKIGSFASEAWAKVPHIRAAQKLELANNPMYKGIAMKKLNRIPLTDGEKRFEKSFYKAFWAKYPEYKKEFGEACRQVSLERKLRAKITSEQSNPKSRSYKE